MCNSLRTSYTKNTLKRGRISRTLVRYSSLSELCLPGELRVRELSNTGGIRGLVGYHHFYRRKSTQDGVVFKSQWGVDTPRRRHVTSRQRHVIQGLDTSCRCCLQVRLQVQGLHTSRRCRLPRYNAFYAAIRRQVFTFADSIRSYSVDEVSFHHRFTVFVTRTLSYISARGLRA